MNRKLTPAFHLLQQTKETMELDCFDLGNPIDILNSDYIFHKGDAPVVVRPISPLRHGHHGTYKPDIRWEFHDDVYTEFFEDGRVQRLTKYNRAQCMNRETSSADMNANRSRERLKKRSLSVDSNDSSNDIPDITTLKRIKRPLFFVKEVEIEGFLKLMGKCKYSLVVMISVTSYF